jgi:hypothetical protein
MNEQTLDLEDEVIPQATDVAPDWGAQIEKIDKVAPVVTNAQTFVQKWGSFSSPVAVICENGQTYVAKGMQIGKAIFNEYCVARLGQKLGAPIPSSILVNFSPELLSISPEISHMPAGLAHGLEYKGGFSDKIGGVRYQDGDNLNAYKVLAVLYGWVLCGDRQFIFQLQPPNELLSVDHGHFFPGGPNWTIDTLNQAGPATFECDIMNNCKLDVSDLKPICELLAKLGEEDIAHAVGGCPQEWSVTKQERIAVAAYLWNRRKQLLKIAGIEGE